MLLLQETETLAPEGKKAPTRHRLIVAAAILFQRRGYYGVGTEEILRLAKAPRGSFYHHFPEGKVALACAAVDWVSQQAVSYSRQLRLAGHSPMKVVKSTVSG
ncbi:MAG: TetR/AcrR family transcriptional regulator, partial [Parvibaculaceae bacterium]|nr:TetR/AcrR family transcriptional regulator [Parvibaculaceae bacterium]